jgi:glyoxylase-like metal-dependent hydrolase (beta-lactamase superfamily II)
MRRSITLGLVIAVGALSAIVRAYQQPPGRGGQPPGQPGAMVVQVDKVKDNLFVLTGGGGNTAVFVQANGVTVVDSKNPGWGRPVLDKIKELTDKPVTLIINTHTHFDHVSGNVEFPATVDVVTHENTKSNMERMRPVTGFPLQQQPKGNIFTENNGRGLPKRTFKDRMTLGSGNDQIDLHYFGRGHTNGDAWVVFPTLRVMHAGDIFAGKNMPIIDVNNGGSGVAYPDTLDKAYQTVKNVDSIITGHSRLMTMADLKEYADFNREFLRAVQEAKKAGRTVDEVAKSWKIPDRFKGYGAPQEERLRSNVQAVFDEIK